MKYLMLSLKTAVSLLFVLAGLSVQVQAEVKPAAYFSDHMVLQRDRPVNVWGTADSGDKITVEFAGQKRSVTVDAKGNWKIVLDAMPANTNASDLIIRSATVVKIRDVLVGDVFICAGGLPVAKSLINMIPGREAATAAARAEPQCPSLRVFSVKKKSARNELPDVEGNWIKAEEHNMERLPRGCLLYGTCSREKIAGAGRNCQYRYGMARTAH